MADLYETSSAKSASSGYHSKLCEYLVACMHGYSANCKGMQTLYLPRHPSGQTVAFSIQCQAIPWALEVVQVQVQVQVQVVEARGSYILLFQQLDQQKVSKCSKVFASDIKWKGFKNKEKWVL